MDWIDEAEREVVERILVLLALLSGSFGQHCQEVHAGRVAGLPLLMRLPLLLALARAEAAAQAYVAALPQAALAGLSPDVTAFDGGPDAGPWAERLAARLLALAAVLTLVLARAACEAPSRVRTAIRRALRSPALRPSASAAFRGPPPMPAPDTS